MQRFIKQEDYWIKKYSVPIYNSFDLGFDKGLNQKSFLEMNHYLTAS